MKKIVRNLAVSVLASAFFLGGCGSGTPEKAQNPQALGIVVANTSNMPAHNMDMKVFNNDVYRTVRYFGNVIVINADSVPSVDYQKDYDLDDHKKKASAKKLDKDARFKTALLKKRMANIVADDPEVDYLASIRACSKAVQSIEGEYDRKIYVFGNGLSTSGCLSFKGQDIMKAEPEKIADMLRKKGELPDLSRLEVVWIGMTETAAPQEPLSGKEADRVREVWSAIIDASGGNLIIKEGVPSSASVVSKRPYVTPIVVAQKQPIQFNGVATDSSFRDPVDLSAQLQFKGNSAELLDVVHAKEQLKPIAEALKNTEVKLLVAGSIAGDVTTPAGMKLSRDRALATANLFEELGVKKDKIECLGLGSNAPWHKKNLGVGENGSVNRRVVIVNADSDYAKRILDAVNV